MTAGGAIEPLGALASWLSGGTPKRSNSNYWGGSIPWISAATLKTTRISDSGQRLTEAGLQAGSKLAPKGSILILVRGMSLHNETRIGLATRPVAFNQDVKALVPGSRVLPEFLVYSLQAQSPQILDLVSSAGSGTGVLNTGLLKRLPIWLPDPKEQQTIAKALDDADALVESLRRLIAKKRAIKEGMAYELLTGRTRLPGYGGAWRTATVGATADVKTGPFGSTLHERDYVAHGTPIITVEHLGEYGIEADGAPMVSDIDARRLRAYVLMEGDIVFSRVGSIDRNARVSRRERGWLFSGRLLRVRFDPTAADSRFMSAQFHSRRFTDAVRSVAVGQTMPSLNTSILKGIEVVLPSLAEQRAIGEAIQNVDRELQGLAALLDKAKACKQGMAQQLLAGRTRLPVLEAVA